jgi:hypothetical protein
MRKVSISNELSATPNAPRMILWLPTDKLYPSVAILALSYDDATSIATFNGWNEGKLIHFNRENRITMAAGITMANP